MTKARADVLLGCLRRLAGGGAQEPPDWQLLERFVTHCDKAALEALVRRHGPLVLGVCRRVLRDPHAAEDAFQATFLVLVRKAGSIGKRNLLANWLYGVAYRTAARARVEAAKRREREAQAPPRPPADGEADVDRRELCAVLDEELNRLPAPYRAPFLLCHVEGRTRDEAARQLGWSLRTLQRRLERGRALLRARLTRRGVTLSATLLSASLAGKAADAAVSPALASATARAALSAAGGTPTAAAAAAKIVIQTAAVARLKSAAGVLVVVVVIGVGAGAFTVAGRPAGGPTPAAAPTNPVPPEPPPAVEPLDPKMIAELAKQLRSKDWQERSAALEKLTKLIDQHAGGDMAIFEPVIGPLFDHVGWGGEAEKESRMAADLLVRIGRPAAPLLRQALQSAEARERRCAAELLVRIRPPGISLVALLRPLTTDKDHYVRRTAIEGLEALGPAARDAIDDLKKATKDASLTNQVRARAALARVTGDDEQVAALAEYLTLVEPCDGAAAFAASELERLGKQAKPAVRKLTDALKHKDAQVRVNAASALEVIDGDADETIAALIDRLKNDPEREVRRTAAAALGAVGPKAKAAVPALRDALKDGGGGWWVAAAALGKIGGADAVAGLTDALANDDADVRLEAIRRLGDLGAAAKPAVEALKKARQDDPREGNRKSAAEAIKKIGD
jgi:RNA polymerase sigma factor (sigma-70 family)